MFDLPKLPNDIINEVLHQIDSLEDIFNISLASRRLRDLSKPHFLRWITFVMPEQSIEWDVEAAFAMPTDRTIRHLQGVDCVFQTKKRTFGQIQIPVKDRGLRSSKFQVSNIEAMRLSLRDLILRIRPGQLRSFVFSEELNNRPEGIASGKKLVNAILTKQNLLSRLELTIDTNISSQPCRLFCLPHLRHFKYNSYDDINSQHVIFSLLHSCQNSLLELHTGEFKALSGFFNFAGAPYQLRALVPGYEAWRHCRLCGQSNLGDSQEKRIRLRNLTSYSLFNRTAVVGKLLCGEQILRDAPITSIDYGVDPWGSPSRFSGNGNANVNLLFSNRNGWPLYPDDFEAYFGSFTGLKIAAFHYQYKFLRHREHCVNDWGWLNALQRNHTNSLKELHVTGLKTSEQELENVGRALPNLENLTLHLDSGIWMAEAVFNKAVFPSLIEFHNRTQPLAGHPAITQTIRRQLLSALQSDILPENLRLIDIYSMGYLIERNTGSAGTIIPDEDINTGNNYGLPWTAADFEKYHLKILQVTVNRLSGKYFVTG